MTLFLPLSLHEMIQQAAARDYSRPGEFIRRTVAKAIEQQNDRDEANNAR